MTKEFAMQLLRLKQELGETEDQAVADALGLSKAAFSDRKRRGAFPDDRVFRFAAENPKRAIDVNYVLTGHHASEVPGAQESIALYEESGPWASNLLSSFGLAPTDGLREPLRGVDVAADGSPRVRNAQASVVQVYARAVLAKSVTSTAAPVARSVQVDGRLLKDCIAGVEEFLHKGRGRMPLDKKAALIVEVYGHFRDEQQRESKRASRTNVVEFIRRRVA